jgi:hypothetical protein
VCGPSTTEVISLVALTTDCVAGNGGLLGWQSAGLRTRISPSHKADSKSEVRQMRSAEGSRASVDSRCEMLRALNARAIAIMALNRSRIEGDQHLAKIIPLPGAFAARGI